MPLVAHNDLPTFERLRAEGLRVLPTARALHQDIRELHIGILNMMPDAALAATERQFLRLVGESNSIAQFYVHLFSLPGLARGAEAQAHIDTYYEPFEKIREAGLDALIITGANVTGPELATQPFWEPLKEVIAWAEVAVPSTLCSCLATHAVMEFRHGQKRVPQARKVWGVFEHHVIEDRHPLVNDVNDLFDVPHSRWNDISRAQFEAAGHRVLAQSNEAGVHLAVSGDGLRFVFFQGHPEYDLISLLKEYKRDLLLWHAGKGAEPPYPAHFLNPTEQAILREYRNRLIAGRAGEFPEPLIERGLNNTWHDTAEAVIDNWMGAIYQVTHRDRRKPFMDHIDPANPLGINW
ncbi:MAG: homoserine O-succinyltransferase [Gammaproteobacteria bacterium]|nr:homoserine O-succinyltransferase [Gammaproteobacteria bacterium]MCP5136772.1 homoserine O-succinyltransferase [Gammaproteobacteria bacterium]